jgi:hypothetical protein
VGRHSIDDDEPDGPDADAGSEARRADDRPAWARALPVPADPVPAGSFTDIDLTWADEPTDAYHRPDAGGRSWRTDRFQSRLMIAGVITLALAILIVVLAVFPGQGTSRVGIGGQSDVDNGPVLGAPGSPYPVVTATSPPAASPPGAVATSAPAPTSASSATDQPAPAGGLSPTVPAPPLLAGALSAVYTVKDSWPGGFIAQVTVNNRSASDRAWQVVIQYPDSVNGYVTGWSNAPAPPSTAATSNSATITGAVPLPAGQSVSVSVQFGRPGSGDPDPPSTCTVNGDACTAG